MASTAMETPDQLVANGALNIIIVATATLLSLLGSFLIIFTYIRFKDLRTLSRHIVVCIAISDLMSSLSSCAGLLISPTSHPQNNACVIQAFLGATFVLSSFLWTMFLAITLYVIIVKHNTDLAERLIFPWFHFTGWCLPLVINVVAVSLNKLGNTGDFETAGWCWIYVDKRKNKDGILWMLIDGKGIELLSYIVIPVLYIVIKIQLRSKIRNYSKGSTDFLTKHSVKAAKITDRKLALIPICFILFRIWGTIRFFLYVSDQKNFGNAKKILLYLQSIGDNSLGAVNCILFCFLTPKVWHRLKDLFWRCFGASRCREDVQLMESDDDDEVSFH